LRFKPVFLAFLCLFIPASAAFGAPAWKPEIIAMVPGLVNIWRNPDNGRVIVVTTDRLFRLKLVRGRTILSPLKATRLTPPPAGAIPQSRAASANGPIASAWLTEPTTRYDHGVLGDDIEAAALKLRTRDGKVLVHRLPSDSVFEDLEPRIVALDDGAAVLVVRSYLARGAALALYRVAGGRIETLAQSAPIGQPNRWLNPIGVGDFDGDGRIEIAAVVTPHLSGRFTLYRREGTVLKRVAERAGYSTHFIGSTVLAMRAIADIDGDGVVDIVLPSLNRRRLIAVSFAGGKSRELRAISHARPIVTAIVTADLDRQGELDFVYGLEGGAVVLIRR
jgi:hypothetical protein